MIFVLEYPISGILNVYHCLIIVYHSNITDSKTISMRKTARAIFSSTSNESRLKG